MLFDLKNWAKLSLGGIWMNAFQENVNIAQEIALVIHDKIITLHFEVLQK